jgi:hypothetical protein
VRQVSTFEVAEDAPEAPSKTIATHEPDVQSTHRFNFDSGYHGSQSDVATEINEDAENVFSQRTVEEEPHKALEAETQVAQDAQDVKPLESTADELPTIEDSFLSAREEQSIRIEPDTPQAQIAGPTPRQNATIPMSSPVQTRIAQSASPVKRSPEKQQDEEPIYERVATMSPVTQEGMNTDNGDEALDDAHSSASSSPIRQIVRKSSLNFASLPAREPLTTKKSIGARASRTSHLEHNRTSYYGRQAGGKSLGNSQSIAANDEDQSEDGEADGLEEMDVDIAMATTETTSEEAKFKDVHAQSKTSTQRLQDQISMLGKSQSNTHRPSKSIPNINVPTSQPIYPVLPTQSQQKSSPDHVEKQDNALGAFPHDEEDDWIGPPTLLAPAQAAPSPRPNIPKSYSTDVMEGVSGKDSISGATFELPKPKNNESKSRSPLRDIFIPEREAGSASHSKSASVSIPRSPSKNSETVLGHKKGISISNPNLASTLGDSVHSASPPPSPTRSYRESPLKASKDKLSSILKFSKGLFASSAAVSAEAKTSTFSPASSRPISIISAQSVDVPPSPSSSGASLYPTLNMNDYRDTHKPSAPSSPTKFGRKTRASTEKDEKRKEKEAKEAQLMAEQLAKLDKAREKEAEKARVFSQEREKVAAMERQVAAQKEQEKLAKSSVDLPRAAKSSPRKTKAQLEAEGIAAAAETSERDAEMPDMTASMPPPAIPRPTTATQIGRPKDTLKRPLKPAKEPILRAKQAPAVIRVETGSQRNHPYPPSNAALAASLHDSLAPSASSSASQNGLRSKANNPLMHNKNPSTSSFTGSISKAGKPKALEAAARKKEAVRYSYLKRSYLLLICFRTNGRHSENVTTSKTWSVDVLLCRRKSVARSSSVARTPNASESESRWTRRRQFVNKLLTRNAWKLKRPSSNGLHLLLFASIMQMGLYCKTNPCLQLLNGVNWVPQDQSPG